MEITMSEILNKYESDKNYNSLSLNQKKALDVFDVLLDSLFSTYSVETVVLISDVVELKFTDKGLGYHLITYESGKCSLGIIDHTNGDSTLNSYDSTLQAAYQVMKKANEQALKEMTHLMSKKFKNIP